MISKLIKKLLFGGNFSLQNYEKNALTCFMDTLGKKEKAILNNQLNNIELIQRFGNNLQVNIYVKEEAEKFNNISEELKVATIDMLRNNKRDNACNLVFHKGLLSSIEFRKKIEGDTFDFSYKVKEIWADLSKFNEEISSKKLLGGYLQKLNEKGNILNLKPPVKDDIRKAFIKDVGNSSDLALFLEMTDGFIINKWTFKGTQSLESVIENRSFFVVAQSEARLLFLDNRGDIVRFSFYDPVNEEILWSKPTLFEAFLEVLNYFFISTVPSLNVILNDSEMLNEASLLTV